MNLPATRTTPGICFDTAAGTFEVTGISIPENATAFYAPVVAWLNQYLPSLQGTHELNFRLSYFNSASLKCLYLILKEVKAANALGLGMKVRWHADADDDLLSETVATFNEVLGMDTELVSPESDGKAA